MIAPYDLDVLNNEPKYQDERGEYYLRFRCMTCKHFTIPVNKEKLDNPNSSAIDCLPGKYPCPVCGQDDQYINVWINARDRHHARSRQLMETQGYVSKEHRDLREVLPDERHDLNKEQVKEISYMQGRIGNWRGGVRRIYILKFHSDLLLTQA